MRFFLRIILVAGLGYVAGALFPQWSIPLSMVGAFLVGILFSQARKRRVFGKTPPPAFAFFAGFIALALLWGFLGWQMDRHNEQILGQQIISLLSETMQRTAPEAPQGSQILIAITALIGGLIGGFSTMTGNLLGEAVKSDS